MDWLLDVDRRQTRVTAVVLFDRSADLEALAARAERWMSENTPEIAAPAAGVALAFRRAEPDATNLAMVTGMFTVLLFVSGIMVNRIAQVGGSAC